MYKRNFFTKCNNRFNVSGPRLFGYILVLVFTVTASSSFAQVITGQWYGVGHVKKKGQYNSYLSEMVLKQKGNKVTGLYKYYFRSDSIQVRVTGKYDPKLKRLELLASPILNFQAKNSNGADCPMEGGFMLTTIKNVITLTGQFNPTYDYRLICPAIDIRFTKYEEPWYEEADETEDTVPKAITVVETIKQTPAKPQPVIKTVDSAALAVTALNKRSFQVVGPVIEVDADSLKVTLYDNGEIDNDTISVFYNRKPVILKKMLSRDAISLNFKLDSTVSEISMFADNLGLIAPNTAVAIIYAGEQRFELNLSSSFTTNSTIRFRRKPKHIDAKNIN